MPENIKLKKILIVEDDSEMQSLYKNMFQKYENEYQVEIEGDARAAYKKVQSEEVDLIILDIVMEPMGGDEFYACLRYDEKGRNIPVLVVSVLNPESIDYIQKRGLVDILQKPITEELLLEKVKAFIA